MVNYYLKNMVRYWKTFVKLIVRRCWNFERCWSEITVEDLFDRFNSPTPPLLIDVRSNSEYHGPEGYIPNARLIPINELNSNFEDLQPYKDKEIVTYCPGGGLSMIAVDILDEAGFSNVKSLHGGLDLWVQNGYPTATS